MSSNDLKNKMVEWRHHLHSIPESAFNEHKTSDYLASVLESFDGMEVHRDFGGTGIVANLKVGDSDKAIAFRADIDCIEMPEDNDNNLEYKSTHENRMHACGHDGHMATLLGAAKLLSENKDFNGTVRFIFQPAEEPGKGADAMIADGLFEKFPVDAIFGFHNMPGIPQGEIHLKEGGIMASEDNFTINIHGIGGHASAPNQGKDPLVVAAEIILALQTIVSRNANPLDTAVVSCTELYMDGIHNAIPSNVDILGDTRSFSPDMQDLIEKRMGKIVKGICEANEVDYEFAYTHEFMPTINTPEEVAIATEAAKKVVGEENVVENCEPLMSSEDFAKYLHEVPGCLVFIGSKKPDKDVVPLHNKNFDYNDDILEIGANYFGEIAKICLR